MDAGSGQGVLAERAFRSSRHRRTRVDRLETAYRKAAESCSFRIRKFDRNQAKRRFCTAEANCATVTEGGQRGERAIMNRGWYGRR